MPEATPAAGMPADPARAPIQRELSLREFLVLGAWIGLLGGLGEVMILAATRFGLHKVIHAGVDVIWAAPLSLGVLGAALALPVAVLARTRIGRQWPSVPVAILCCLGLANIALAVVGIHPWAKLLLVVGIAARIASSISRHPERWVKRSSRTMLPLLAGLGLVAAGIPVVHQVRERRLIAALPAPAPGLRNILLLVLDSERALDLSVYGYARRTTPTLERLAREGILFDRAYATSSWTLSSHASMFTGRLPSELKSDWTTPLDPRYTTLAEELVARGYITGGFSANPFYVSRAAGLAQGFMHFEGWRLTPASVLLRSAVASWLTSPRFRGRLFDSYQFPGRKSARHLRNAISEWLEEAPADRPYFVFANFFDAHQPYLPPAPFDTAFTGRATRWSGRNAMLDFAGPVSRADLSAERMAYDQVIASQDRELAYLLDHLETTGRLRNTIIAVTADHGEEFGEHGLLEHGLSLNPAVLWVPLIIRDPASVLKGVRIPEPVSLIDLAATLLGLADTTRPPGLPGSTLLDRSVRAIRVTHSLVIAELPQNHGKASWIPVSSGPLRSLTSDSWHYVVDGRGRETLMDLTADRAGRVIRASSPVHRALVTAFRRSLDSASPPHLGTKTP